MIEYLIVAFIAITVFRYDLFLREIMMMCYFTTIPGFYCINFGNMGLGIGVAIGWSSGESILTLLATIIA